MSGKKNLICENKLMKTKSSGISFRMKIRPDTWLNSTNVLNMRHQNHHSTHLKRLSDTYAVAAEVRKRKNAVGWNISSVARCDVVVLGNYYFISLRLNEDFVILLSSFESANEHGYSSWCSNRGWTCRSMVVAKVLVGFKRNNFFTKLGHGQCKRCALNSRTKINTLYV